MDDETNQILIKTAQKLIILRDEAKYRGNSISMYAHQDFLNACMDEDYQISKDSKSKLSSLELFDKESQKIPHREIISKNLEQVTKIQAQILQGYISRGENKSCILY